MITARLFFICLFCCAVVRTTDAHNDGGKHDHDHRLHQHDHKGRDDDRQLGIGDDFTTLIASNSSKSRGPCKDGEPSFTVGQVTFQCLADFHQNGQMCGTPIMSPEEEAKAVEDFQAWKMMKANYIMQLEAGVAIAGSVMAIDWSNPSTVITIPTYFHMIHSGNSGKQFTYASNPSYIQNQIKALNIGFQGENSAYSPSPNGRSYERYSITNADARIRFCLAGTTATDNASWYTVSYGSSAERAMKTALKKGGMETLNVYVGNLGNGLLGWSNFPNTVSAVLDGVVLLNESMPGGAPGPYNQGDSLTHEIGHWLSLWHTFQNGCLGAGDYMDLAPPSADYTKIAAKEKNPSYGCPVGLNDCTNDSGKKNPIHSFMSYVDDNCMDQFTPGQIYKMQQAWETYRHKFGYSELFSVAEDGFSCVGTTAEPTSSNTNTAMPTIKPTTMNPTTVKPTTTRPTPLVNIPTRKPTKKPNKK